MEFENVEHIAILLGVMATVLGLVKGLTGWRRARDEAIVARAKQQEKLDTIAAEFTPRNGRTLATVVADTEKSVHAHHEKADKWFTDNDEAHKDIHRRIDGLFEVLMARGQTDPRRLADRHAQRSSAQSEPAPDVTGVD
jgi:hypothetical protein